MALQGTLWVDKSVAVVFICCVAMFKLNVIFGKNSRTNINSLATALTIEQFLLVGLISLYA